MRSLPHVLLIAALAAALAACGGLDAESDASSGTDQPDAPASNDDTSMPADEDAEPSGEVSQAEAEAIGGAYLGLTEAEAQAQAQIDGRQFRVGARDGEQFMLTEDYVLGRVTATIAGDVITEVTVEATDGPVTVSA